MVLAWANGGRGVPSRLPHREEQGVDNIVVTALLFRYFTVPAALQPRVLLWGVVGAIVMRAALIVAGAALFERFHWVIYVFGGQLVVTGFRMALQREDKVLPERNSLLRLARRIVPVTKEYCRQHFVLRESGRLVSTPISVTLRRQPRRSVPEDERGMSRGSVLVLSSPLSPLDRGKFRAPRLGLRATVVAECGSGRANIRRGPREVRIHRPERTPDVPERQAGIVDGTGAWRGEVDVAVHDGIKRRTVSLV